jgi:multiple sugar transport system substrate-binding protein
MKTPVKLRMVGALISTALGAATLSGCAPSSSPNANGETTVTMMAWANAEESKMYNKVLDEFHKENPDISVKLEYTDVGTYKDKLNTKFAAGSPPDVFFMVGGWIGEYTSRNALLDYAQYKDTINFDAIDPAMVKANTTDGHIYSIPTGSTAAALVVNTGLLAKYNVPVPDDNSWSWDDFAKWSRSITDASGGVVNGSAIDMSWPPTFSAYVRQQGENLFTEDGKLGVKEETVAKWFEMTKNLYDTKAFAPAQSADQTGSFSPEQSPFGAQKIASTVIPSNGLPAYAKVLGDDNVKLLRFPGETTNKQRGQLVTPTLLWTSPANTKHPKEVAKLVEFLTNNKASYTDRGTFLGVPVNAEVAAEVGKNLTPSEQKFTSFVTELGEEKLPALINEPAKAGTVTQDLTSIVTEVSFGRLSPQDAAKKFIANSNSTLSQG